MLGKLAVVVLFFLFFCSHFFFYLCGLRVYNRWRKNQALGLVGGVRILMNINVLREDSFLK